MNKILGGKGKSAQPSQFQESQAATALDQTKSSNAPRRELVQITLRETMRRHGIPSDWIDCRTLSVLTKHHKQGMHVQFLVRKGDHQVLPWLHAFQESFWEQVLRTDPRAHDWLFSVGWEFYGKSEQGFHKLPGTGAWKEEDTEPAHIDKDAGDTLPPDEEDALATDLQKLQAMMTQPGELTEIPDTPRKR
ncbi:hypothetical protein [Ramlibacter sp. PS4R-6]|uniref:hypothetical protein n=1 Tax=Ramlibacter sp. PS4R-6 TaxID=3133438 RepID=UPI0030B41B77